jgi:hypothetical protein
MPVDLRLPVPVTLPTVETPQMRRTVRVTKTAIPDGGLVVWTGKARLGKTTTAQWLVDSVERTFDPSDNRTFRARHYQTGEIGRGDQQKQAVRSLYAQVHGVALTHYAYSHADIAILAEQVVKGLIRKNIRLLLVDEAGCLSLDAIRGMVLVTDTAKNMGWPTSLVLIGMDDLPHTVERLEQIRGRIHAYCNFVPYNLEETKELLAALHPHFAGLARKKSELDVEAQFIFDQFGGVPGTIAYFLHQVDASVPELGGFITLGVLKAVRELLVRDRSGAFADMQSRSRRPVPAPKRA